MARTNKTGIDYFPLDVDFFQDDKVMLLEGEFGIKGGYIALRLLCKIYKEGYFYKWGADACLLFTRTIGMDGVSKGLVDEVIKVLIKRSFFDKDLFERYSILTSKGIQKRYFEATKRYKQVVFFEEYLLLENINAENVSIIRINGNSNPQKKGKEKEKKVDIITASDDKLDWRNDYEIYLSDLRAAYDELTNDNEFLERQQRYNPALDIVLTLEKACMNFWATPTGWQHKKKSKGKTVNWKQTLTNAISSPLNKVYKT